MSAKVTRLKSIFPNRQSQKMSQTQKRENLYAYLFLSPWLIGFFGLFLGPGLVSLYLSFTKYDVLSAPEFIGFDNYTYMFTKDPLFWPSLGRTFYYSLISVPLAMIGSMFLAMGLNSALKGISIFRTLFFVPSLVPLVAAVILWQWLLNSEFGIVNQGLRALGAADPPGWFSERSWAIPSLIILSLWQSMGGVQMIIFLAGLQGIPDSLYDSASVDGANAWQKFLYVTIPMLTSTIFFNTVLGIIGALQTFSAAFVASGGGPGFATWFFGLHIWKQAFDYYNMGYGAALAWFFAIIIVILTIIQVRLSNRWVFYYGE